jgi:hypothetical protein
MKRYARISEAQEYEVEDIYSLPVGDLLCRVLPDGAKKIKVGGKWVALSSLEKVGTVKSRWIGNPVGDIVRATDGDLYFVWHHAELQRSNSAGTDTNTYIEKVEESNAWYDKLIADGIPKEDIYFREVVADI